MKDIYILGVGHNTPVLIELAELNNYTIKGLYHYEEGMTGETMCGFPIIGTNSELFAKKTLTGLNFALSMGNNKLRCELAKQIRDKEGFIPTLIHPTASVSKYATIANDGVIIQANATIQPDVIIRKDTVISFNVGISHNTTIEEGCYIACQTIIGAYVHIEEFVLVGIGATVVSGKVPYIGTGATVGAASVVTKAVEKEAIVMGNPAKKIN